MESVENSSRGRKIILERSFSGLQGIRLKSTELHYESELGVRSEQSRYSYSAVILIDHSAAH